MMSAVRRVDGYPKVDQKLHTLVLCNEESLRLIVALTDAIDVTKGSRRNKPSWFWKWSIVAPLQGRDSVPGSPRACRQIPVLNFIKACSTRASLKCVQVQLRAVKMHSLWVIKI